MMMRVLACVSAILLVSHAAHDSWEESSEVAKNYISLHHPLIAIGLSDDGQTKVALDQEKFDAIHAQIKGGAKHIKLINTGMKNMELEVSPFEVFTQDALIESEDGPMARPEMIHLRGKVAGQEKSFVSLSMGKHGAFGVVQSSTGHYQLSVPTDRSAHAILMDVTKDGKQAEVEASEIEATDETESQPIQLAPEVNSALLMTQTKVRATTDNFDATGTQPVLTVAVECDKKCRDLFQSSGSCLAEFPTTLVVVAEDHLPARRLMSAEEAPDDDATSTDTWSEDGVCEDTETRAGKCTQNKNKGKCTKNWMKRKCAQTCGECEADDSTAATNAPTDSPTNAAAASSAPFATDQSESCAGWVSSGYNCDRTEITSTSGSTSTVYTLAEFCPQSCGVDVPTPAPTPNPTYAPGDGVAGCTHPAATYIATLIAATSTIYSRDVGVTLQISYMKVWSGSTDYDSGTASLGAFKSAYTGVTGTQKDADIAHLFTGIVEGGVAYVGTACNNQGYNTGVSSIRGTWQNTLEANAYNWDVIVTAHEMGHNVGSGHTHDSSSYNPTIDSCVSSSGQTASRGSAECVRGTIMSYCHLCGGTANVDMRLDTQVQEVVKDNLNGGSCNLNSL